MGIQKIHARYVYDSRGNPTVEVDLVDNLGLHRAIVPSGKRLCPSLPIVSDGLLQVLLQANTKHVS